jgi:hypothetical protein
MVEIKNMGPLLKIFKNFIMGMVDHYVKHRALLSLWATYIQRLVISTERMRVSCSKELLLSYFSWPKLCGCNFIVFEIINPILV